MADDDRLRVDPSLPQGDPAKIPDPAATAPLPERRDERLSLPPMVASELFDGSDLDPSALMHDDGVKRTWDAERGVWVAPDGLDRPNTYAVTPSEPAPRPRQARPRRRQLPPYALHAALYGVVVGTLLLLLLALGLYLLT